MKNTEDVLEFPAGTGLLVPRGGVGEGRGGEGVGREEGRG